MAKIQIVARINFDVVVRLDGPVSSGAQLKGQFQPGRLGGGGANTGVALCHAGHDVSLFADVGNDAAGDGMLTQLAGFGADVSRVRRLEEASPPVMVLLDPAGERTIIRGSSSLSAAPSLPEADEPADALYIKTYGPAVADLMRARLDRCLVVSHAPPAGTSDWPAHVLVNSAAHMTESELADPLAYAREPRRGSAALDGRDRWRPWRHRLRRRPEPSMFQPFRPMWWTARGPGTCSSAG